MKSLFSCFKNRSDFKFDCASNLLKLCQCQDWCPLTLVTKFLTLVPKNCVTTLVFVRRIDEKDRIKMAVSEVVETRDRFKFCA